MPLMRSLAIAALAVLGSFPLLSAPSFHVNPPQLAPATVGKAYTGGPLMVSGGGQCPRNYSSVRLVGGALPPGLYLSPAGDFVGAPMEPGRFEFVVRVENGCGWSDQMLTLEVAGAPILLANPSSLQFRILPGQRVAPAVLQVSANVPGTPYTVSSSAPWIRAQARAGRIPAAASVFSADLVEVEIDSAALPPGSHRGSIELGAWRAGQGAIVPVEVEVLTAAGTPAGISRWNPASPDATPVLVVPQQQALPLQPVPGSAPADPNHQNTAHAQAGHGAPAAHPKQPTAMPRRLSRSAQLRSKYLAAKPAAKTPPPAAAAAAHPPAAADPHAKPSPVGEKKPAATTGAHGAPAQKDAHGAAAPAAKKDDHGAPAAKKDAHGAAPAAKKDDHAAKPAEKAKDGHGAAKDEHKSKPKEEHKDKPKH